MARISIQEARNRLALELESIEGFGGVCTGKKLGRPSLFVYAAQKSCDYAEGKSKEPKLVFRTPKMFLNFPVIMKSTGKTLSGTFMQIGTVCGDYHGFLKNGELVTA